MKLTIQKKLILRDRPNDPCSVAPESCLLQTLRNYVITNESAKELLVLNDNFDRITTISSPAKSVGSYSPYKNKNSDKLLFELKSQNHCLILDSSDFSVKKIISNAPYPIFLTKIYVWENENFFSFTCHSNLLIHINTKRLTIDYITRKEGYVLSPHLKRLEQIYESHSYYEYIYEEQVFIALDYKKEKSLFMVNFEGETIREISMKEAILSNFDLAKNEISYYPERAPHEIRYQRGWVIIVWEKQTVIISPSGKQGVKYADAGRTFTHVQFLESNKQSMNCVILICDENYVKESSLERWHIEDQL